MQRNKEQMSSEQLSVLQQALSYSRQQQQATLSILYEFLRIPSVSTLPEHRPDIERAAGWLAAYLQTMGMEQVEVLPTAGYPVVYGEWMGVDAEAPTLLVYGHYDVQPVDPLEEWRTPPFEPTMQGENLYGRGASDDKAQILAVLAAVEAYLQTSGRLPIRLKVMFEGEEEVSSPHMAAFLAEHRQRLGADAVLICDSAMFDAATPLIEYGVRGMCYLQVEVEGPAGDLHSGVFGGAVDNPFNVLARMLAAMQDGETRRVLVPGFYDRVRPLDAGERALLASLPPTEETTLALTGAPALAGEAGYTLAERVSARPTFEIHGMPGGFIGEGKKTVIPARATAKISMRLVPDQDPQEIAALCKDFLLNLAPATVRVNVRTLGLARPAVIDYRAPAIQAAAQALEQVFGRGPVYRRGGGTLPIIPEFQDVLKAPVVMMGFGLPDDNAHAPNEKIHVPTLFRGVETLIRFFSLLAEREARP